ncbi:hypothetical protein [Dyadobacter sp. CY347]|uniref:hypothetical protein n=1 Tax=Dyadobacter sp. CY347 TaxID=2909336 RepID=UPI001F33D99C|nr:hypothetical protein [Dyadobacter sp. CY347]MCF2487481.1 hypothetical protein [Dyadobacter sp. CY347]
MAKIITFSRTFPAYHPKAGQPTDFVHKIWKSIPVDQIQLVPYAEAYFKTFPWDPIQVERFSKMLPKHHTIRAGHRWEAGEVFSPRVWSGKPYNSPMITIAPDIKIEKVWNVEVDEDGCFWVYCNREGEDILDEVAQNDGLSRKDLLEWFDKPFAGQIICWNKNISY